MLIDCPIILESEFIPMNRWSCFIFSSYYFSLSLSSNGIHQFLDISDCLLLSSTKIILITERFSFRTVLPSYITRRTRLKLFRRLSIRTRSLCATSRVDLNLSYRNVAPYTIATRALIFCKGLPVRGFFLIAPFLLPHDPSHWQVGYAGPLPK